MTGTSRRRLLGGAAAVAVAAIAVVVGLSVIGSGADSADGPDGATGLSTALVAQRDLAEHLEISGTLDYAGTMTLSAGSDGALMHLADEGSVVRQGEQLYLMVYEPTDEDTARVLAAVASALAEIAVSEAALADLRAGPSEAEIATAEAALLTAEEHLADVQADATQAEIDAADAAVLSADQALADLLTGPSAEELAAAEASLASATASLLSANAELDALEERHRPMHLMYGETPAYRTMAEGLEGSDIRQLEANLAGLGFGDIEGFDVDGVFDARTADAVRSWQHETGQNVDGMVTAADVLFAAGPVQVGSWGQGIETGQYLAAGTTLATLTVIETPSGDAMATTQRVIADLPLSDRDLIAEGIAVNVELPDDTDVAGAVTAINPTPELDAQSGENIVEVTILLTEPASPVWIGASVTVEITETLIADALVVPATALLALTEGGYAVEVLNGDGTTYLVGVETGIFVDGDVEVASADLRVGMQVVVPR
jgi:multidrug efflux pump subunit AcrA (membrane-fusion protein)